MARKTTFRAEAVLKLRAHREADAKQAFAAAASAIETIDARLASLQQALDAYNAEVRQAMAGRRDAAGLGRYRDCVAGIHQALADEHRRRDVLVETLRCRRQDLLAARKQHQALRQLKDKVARRAVHTQQQTETTQCDDLYVTRTAGRKYL